MKLQLKPLKDQVMVITGASSGIGLATARLAARRGVRLVLAARSDDALRRLVDEIRGHGGKAIHVECDVGREQDVRNVAQAAEREFGGFDTWVNNAGASVYGPALEVSTEDMRRVIDTNLFGVIFGSREAVRHLRRRGGALINIGSETSDRAVPLQAIYSASKHAVKGWTDALRSELDAEGAPVAVTLIKPGPIDTPYTRHAKNYMEDQPTHVPPVYKPESVAAAILHAAATPTRELVVGSGARFVMALEKLSPRLTDRIMTRVIAPGTHSGRPRTHEEALHTPGGRLEERGDYQGMARRSVYTQSAMHPMLTSVVALAAAGAVTAAWRASGRAPHGSRREHRTRDRF
jgi:short-subunit dehydrogenase